MSSSGSRITVNVGQRARTLDAVKSISARATVDKLAKRYQHGVNRAVSKLARASTRDEYAVSEGGTAKVVASYPVDGNDYNVVQRDGMVYIVKTPAGYSGKLDLGSHATGGAGEIGSLTDQNNQDLLDGKQGTDDAVHAQLRRTNAANRRFYAKGGSSNMTAHNSDELWQGVENGGSELVEEGDDTANETMDRGTNLAAMMNRKNRAAYERWSPAPRKVVA